MIYIAYNYKGEVISIVSAKSLELANAYWHGADITPHTHKCLEKDFIPLDQHPTGVIPILKTEPFRLQGSDSIIIKVVK